MKLFRDKNRGPKVKSEDVVIPEAYLEYEREAEEKKRQEARKAEHLAEESVQEAVLPDSLSDVEAEMDAFKARLDNILNSSSLNDLQEATPSSGDQTESDEKDAPLEIEVKRKSVTRAQRPQESEEKVDTEKTKKNKPKPKRDNPYPPAFIGFLVGIVVVVAFIVVMLGPVMAIDEVDVGELQYISEDKVIEMAGMPIGDNLFRYRASKAEDALLEYPYVEDVKISRHLPHRLEIHITERQPAGVLLNNGNYLQFSKDGILLDNTKSLSSQSLPIITGFSMEDVPAPGERFKDDKRFKDILRIINACDDDLLRMLQEINIKDRNDILAYTSQGIEIRIGSVENIEVRMATLNDIINQVILSGIIEEPIEAIDIRYEKSPVVVLEGYSNIDVSEYTEAAKEEEMTDLSPADSQDDAQNSASGANNVENSNNSGAENGAPQNENGVDAVDEQ